jgi:hypothetical protein
MKNNVLNKDRNIELTILRVATLSFRSNEFVQLSAGPNNANVNIGVQTMVDLEKNFVALNVKVTFTPIEDQNIILMEGDFQTIFGINDLASWKNQHNEILLPDDANYTMMTIALSHSRALFANISANGPFKHLIIPILSKEWIERELLKKQ